MSIRRDLRNSAADSAQVVGSPSDTPGVRVSMQVALAFVSQRVNVWLRFGKPLREAALDRWRRSADFAAGTVCCRVKWIGNEFGTALWQLMVLQAPNDAQAGAQRVAGVVPGAWILLRASGHAQVRDVLCLIDGIEALGIDPCAVAPSYWCTVGNRLAARAPLPVYMDDRHAAHLAREALR